MRSWLACSLPRDCMPRLDGDEGDYKYFSLRVLLPKRLPRGRPFEPDLYSSELIDPLL